MYVSTDGVLTDYYGGEDDLKSRKLVFIGEVERRIQEDFIRILRYFRFHTMVSGKSLLFPGLKKIYIRIRGDGHIARVSLS